MDSSSVELLPMGLEGSVKFSPTLQMEVEEIGIKNELLRFAVGIEAAEDLIADIEQAIEKARR